MMISHVQPLFLLLASLFFLPALHAVTVDFNYCNGIGYPFLNVTSVRMDPIVPIYGPSDYPSFWISGFATGRPLHSGTVTVARKVGNEHIPILWVDVCVALGQCPILPGSKFSLFIQQVNIYSEEYGNADLSITIDKTEDDILTCVYFGLPTSVVSA